MRDTIVRAVDRPTGVQARRESAEWLELGPRTMIELRDEARGPRATAQVIAIRFDQGGRV